MTIIQISDREIALQAQVTELTLDRDELRQQLSEAQTEIKRLQVEVCNRNRRALEGDKAEAAFDKLYIEHEELRIQVEASRKQEPVSYIYGLMGDDDYSSTPVYTTPVVADDVQRDAERYRFLFNCSTVYSNFRRTYGEWDGSDGKDGFDAVIDAAIAAMKGAS